RVCLHYLHTLPPTPTLCPYTTLFRSRLHHRQHHLGEPLPGVRAVHRRRLEQVVWHQREAGHQQQGHERRGLPHLGQHDDEQRRKDRKSTRLNSSHVKISYAVFCLKKK